MTSFSFDLNDAYSEFKLIAIMTWPFDAQARTDYLVTQGAEILDLIEDEGANCLGLDQFVGVIDYNEAVDSLRHDVDLNLYAAHGGRRRLKNTAGISAINKSAEEQGQRFGSACGELLAYVAVMAEHHVELGPSLSRAMRIQEKFASEQKRYLPGNSAIKHMWQTWAPIAPLWAALSFLMGADPSINLSRAETRRQLVSWAGWLTDFATTYKPKHSRECLMPPEMAIRICGGVASSKPRIQPLSPKRLAWATDYKAPKDIWS